MRKASTSPLPPGGQFILYQTEDGRSSVSGPAHLDAQPQRVEVEFKNATFIFQRTVHDLT